jgi:hypothetical protein
MPILPLPTPHVEGRLGWGLPISIEIVIMRAHFEHPHCPPPLAL